MCHWLYERQWGETGEKSVEREEENRKKLRRVWKNSEESALTTWMSGKLCYLVIKHLAKYNSIGYRNIPN